MDFVRGPLDTTPPPSRRISDAASLVSSYSLNDGDLDLSEDGGSPKGGVIIASVPEGVHEGEMAAQEGGNTTFPPGCSEEQRQVVGWLHALLTARTMAEHEAAFNHLAEDVEWDAPPIWLKGRDRMRTVVYWVKTVLEPDCTFLTLKSEVLEGGVERLELVTDYTVTPKRRWWFPWAFFLPTSITVRDLFTVDVKPAASSQPADMNEVGMDSVLALASNIAAAAPTAGAAAAAAAAPAPARSISVIYGRIEDTPALPDALRCLNALLAGLGAMAQPLWQPLLPLLGDNSCCAQKEHQE